MHFIGKILAGFIGFFSNNGTGHTVGTVAANGAAILALAPALIWLIANKDAPAVTFTFTYGQLAIMGGVMFFLVKIIHYTRAGSPRSREEYRDLS